MFPGFQSHLTVKEFLNNVYGKALKIITEGLSEHISLCKSQFINPIFILQQNQKRITKELLFSTVYSTHQFLEVFSLFI